MRQIVPMTDRDDSHTRHMSATPLKFRQLADYERLLDDCTISLACCASCSLAYFQPRRVRPCQSPGVPYVVSTSPSSGRDAQPQSLPYRLFEPGLHVC